MGRYFQHAGWPSGDHELTGAVTEVASSPVSFHSSGGVHLVLFTASVNNATAAVADLFLRARLDGAGRDEVAAQRTFAAGEIGILTGVALLEIAAGDHTLAVEGRGVAAAGDVVMGFLGVLAAIEFPSWEASDRVEAL